MQNPIDVLGVHPHGGINKTPDSRDYPWHPDEITQASVPFEWKEVDNPDIALAAIVGDSAFRLPRKNQSTSGSCGGQAVSYQGQILSKLFNNEDAERSAKYLYSQVYVPGGGSDPRALANIAIRQGFGLESLTPSYENGAPPSEAFMERSQDITPAARIAAAKNKIMLAYSFPKVTLESVAQATFAARGGLLLLHGSNNGTWLSDAPHPPTQNETLWTHYMDGLIPGIYKKQKGIWAMQSWGSGAGFGGWQHLNETYFASGNILDCMALVSNYQPEQPPQYVFNSDLKQGDSGDAVTALQTFLAYDGEFNLAPTGLYGQITAQAVLKFQIKYKIADLGTLEELGGHVVGPATRAKLNSLVGTTH